MKVSFGVLALVAVDMIGCGSPDTNNAPSPPTPAANNGPLIAANNAPEATNEPESSNIPEAANNVPTANNSPIDVNKPDPKKPDPKKPPEPPKIPDPAAPGKDNWTKNQLEAKKLTESLDANMKAVKNVRMRTHQDIAVGKFRGYFDNSESGGSLIGDQTHFVLRYATTDKAKEWMDSFIVTKHNGKFETLVGQTYQPGRVSPDKDVLKGWELNATHYICDGVGTSVLPFTNLVTAAQKAKWKISVETKKYATGTYQRVIMESPSEPKKRYELMIEPKLNLPVSFNTVVFEKKKVSTNLAIAWDKSDKPLTDAELTPKIETVPVKVMTADEAKKKGIKLKN